MFNFRSLIDAASKISPTPVRPTRGHAHTPMPTPVREDYGPEEDAEGEMATSQLKSLEEKSVAISSMLKPESKLEAWVQSKITLAEDYINTVHDYLKNTPQVPSVSLLSPSTRAGSRLRWRIGLNRYPPRSFAT